jgi:hypothetical protein
LPIKRLTRATRNGQSKLAAEQEHFAGQFNPYQNARGEGSHRKGVKSRKTLVALCQSRQGVQQRL